MFQSEDALLATRLVLPPSPGCCAFLYNDGLVYACSTGMARLAVPDEKISFSSPGERESIRFKQVLSSFCQNLFTMLFYSTKSSGLFPLYRRWRTRWRLLRQPTRVFLPEQRPGGSGGSRERLHPAGDDGRLAVLLADCCSRGKSPKRRSACRTGRFKGAFVLRFQPWKLRSEQNQ